MSSITQEAFLQQYQMIRLLGKGTTASVFEISNKITQQKYALKLLKLDSSCQLGKAFNQIQISKCIEHESSLKTFFYYVKSHDNYIEQKRNKYHEVGIIMEKGEETLQEQLQNRKKNKNYYSQQQLASFLIQMVDCLAEMQTKGYIHRDIKPSNILKFKSKDGDRIIYKICDFGFAVKNSQFSSSVIAGSFFYTSPKIAHKFTNPQLFVQGNNFKDDVYSLGLTFLQMLSLSQKKPKESIQQDLKKVKQSYSQKFLRITKLMIQKEELYRPDFLELAKYLNKIFKNTQQNQSQAALQASPPNTNAKPNSPQKIFSSQFISKIKTKRRIKKILPYSIYKESAKTQNQRKLELQQTQDKIQFKGEIQGAGLLGYQNIIYAYSPQKLYFYYNGYIFETYGLPSKIRIVQECHKNQILIIACENHLIGIESQDIHDELLKTLAVNESHHKKYGFYLKPQSSTNTKQINLSTMRKSLVPIDCISDQITCVYENSNKQILIGWNSGFINLAGGARIHIVSEPISKIFEIDMNIYITTTVGKILKYKRTQSSSAYNLQIQKQQQLELLNPIIKLSSIKEDIICITANGFMHILDADFEKKKIIRISNFSLKDALIWKTQEDLNILGMNTDGTLVKYTDKYSVKSVRMQKNKNPFLKMFSNSDEQQVLNRFRIATTKGQILTYQL